MNIVKDGLKASISEENFKALLKKYTPCDSIEISYYIGDYYYSVDFNYLYNGISCVASLTCDLKNERQVLDFVHLARALGYKLVNLSLV